MFPWELVVFGVGWLLIVFILDWSISNLQKETLVNEIEEYLTYLEMEQKEDDNG